MDTAVFDADRYKTTTRDQWQNAAEAWHRWGPFIDRWLGDATEVMLDLAGVRLGSAVLDVAAGSGGQTLTAARRVGAVRIGPGDRHLTGDPRLRANTRPTPPGSTQVSTQVVDGEALDVPAGSFDAVISRVGLIYFPDQQAALAGMRRALRPGGRVAAVVYTTPDRNEFFSIPVSIIRSRAQLPPPLPGQPGPFSLGAPGVIEAAFESAGFTNITTTLVPSPLRLASAAECVRFERESFGALHQMLATLDPAERDDTWREIEAALSGFDTHGPDGFVGPCEMLVAAGTNEARS